MQILQVEHLHKVYGKGNNEVKAVNDVSFSVEKGEFIAIMGPSGCGKSTLLHLLGGVEHATSGVIHMDDLVLTSLNENELTLYRRRNIGIVYQFYNLLPVCNVRENITLPLRLDGQKVDEALVKSLLQNFHLKDREKHLPSQLSGGQQQRVAFARAVITAPKLILADEPTGNLDKENSKEIMNYIKMIHKDNNRTILLVTHDIEIAKQADRIFWMEDGRIIKDEVIQHEGNM